MMPDLSLPLGRQGRQDPHFSDDETTRFVFYWCLLWVTLHYLAWPLWQRRRVLGLICSPTPVERYRRRLCRSQVYCSLAVLGGLRLLLGCRWSAQDLLYAYSDEHQVLFSMAIGHWLVSVWEDLQNWTFLRGGLSAKDTQNGGDPSYFLWQAYLVHHLVAAVAFACALRMRVCTGLAAFGLIFELPVLYMNHREFIVYAEQPVEWFQDIRQVELFWSTLILWWRLARGVPTMVYIYSLIFWSEDLARLSNKEAWTYHGMAIFFSVLNWALASTYLGAWQKKDLEVASSAAATEFEEKFRELLKPDDEVQLAEKEKKAEESSIAQDIPEVVKKPLMQVPPEMFAKAQGEEGQLWLEIDNVAYDLTEFLGKHPGGDSILRKFAGKDASKAFHKAKHSMQAKMQMQMYCLGPMMKELKVYRMFEHTTEVRTLFFRFMQVSALLAAACWMLPNSYYPSVRSLHAETTMNRLLAPGLVFTLGSSTLIMPGRSRFNPANWTCGALYFAACFTSLLVGLELARRPVVSSTWPSGLEIGTVLIFVVEELLIHLDAEGWKFLFWRRNTLAAALVILSWHWRGATLDMVDQSPEHALGGALIGISVPMLCRLGSSNQEAVMDQAFQGLALTSFFCFPCLLYLLMPETDGIRTLVSHAWESWTINTLVMAFGASISALVFVALVLSDACNSGGKMASRTVGIMFSLAALLRSGFSSWRWLLRLAWYTLIGTLGLRNVAVLNDQQEKGKLGEVGVEKIAVRASLELFYLVLGALIWQVLQGSMKYVVNALMPQELQFYAPWLPFFELGEDVDIGVAAYYAPKEALKSKDGPQHFVCSMRHMDTAHPEGQRDLQLQRNTAREMWMKCKDTSIGGLVANVNCFFPRLSGSTHCKEINLSGWVSSEAAEAWSAKHSGLPGVQSQSSRGQMRTLGSMQAILKPHGEIRHQDRCSSCARLSESETLGEKAPERCRYCGKKNYGYPFF